MEFVNPMMLAGLGLASIPVVLHLVMRARPKQVEFPALRFIRQRRESNRRRMRLRHLLLLALRVAAIVLLVTALARPTIRPEGGGAGTQGPVAAVMIFDTAPRMGYRHENQSRLEVARELGFWVLDQLPLESRVAVLETRAGVPVFQVDLGAARQRVERLDTVSNDRPLVEVLTEAITLLEEAGEPRNELYIYSDLSRAAWAGELREQIEARLAELPGLSIFLIDVGVAQPENFALNAVSLSSEFISQTGHLRLDTELSCLGDGGERSVELYLDDGSTGSNKRSEQRVRLEPDSTSALEFSLAGMDVGTHQGHVRLVGADALAADDIRYFTVEVHAPLRILIAAAEPADDRAFVFTEALAPERFRRTGQAQFDCEVISVGDLGAKPLGSFAAVCLLDPPPLGAAQWGRLSDFVSQGGGLAVLLGPSAGPPSKFNTTESKWLLPATIVRQSRRGDGDVFLAPDRYDHSLWRKFSPLGGSIPWARFPVYRYWQLGDFAEGAQTIARFSDGQPALIERPLGRGRVLLMTTPLNVLPTDAPTWNLLPTGIEPWPFVMLVNEMMFYASGSREERRNYESGETAFIPLGDAQTGSTYVLFAPENQPFRRTIDRKQQAIVVPTTGAPGHYRMRSGGNAKGLNHGFSVNLAPRATALERADETDLERVLGELPIRRASRREEITLEIDRGRSGRELYAPLILLAAILLAAEYVTANRFHRDESGNDSADPAPPGDHVRAGRETTADSVIGSSV